MVARINLTGLINSHSKDVITGCFEHEGVDYYVRPTQKFGIWDVIKVSNDGPALAIYKVQRDRKYWICDCPAGHKHLACRHKEMVQMFIEGK